MRNLTSRPFRLLGLFLTTLGLLLPATNSRLSPNSEAHIPAMLPAQPANTLTVTNTNNGGAGSLRDAIANAQPNDTVAFNLNNCPCTIALTSELVINKSLTIQGPGANQLTVSGNNTVRVFNIAVGTFNVMISGITIANGKGANNGGGGGIFNASTGSVNINNSTLSGNVSADLNCCGGGGGIFNSSTGTVNVTDSLLSGNTNPFTGRSGGAIYNTKGTVNVTNSTLVSNTAAEIAGGGAIFNANGTVSVVNSTLSGNIATVGSGGSSGGAIYNIAGASLTIIGSLFSNNSGKEGGAIFNSQSSATIINSTFSGNSNNTLGRGGGAIFNNGGTVTIINTTVSGNSTRESGGGVFNVANATVNTKNTIVALNNASISGPDLSGNFTSQGYNLIGKADGSTGLANGINNDIVGSNATPLNPMLGPLANNGGFTQTMGLLSGSPALDRGSATNSPSGAPISNDQRGLPRPFDLVAVQNAPGGNGSDIGAFEAQSPPTQRRPVIFIPGIGGSELRNFPALSYNPNPLWPSVGHFLPSGSLLLGNPYLLDRHSPVAGVNVLANGVIRRTPAILGNQDIYESLLASLISNGYIEYDLASDPNRLTSSGCDVDGQRNRNPNLFLFPYDWRLSNSINAQRLQDYVVCIKRFFPEPGQKIDLVTHSMGGLLARSYLLQNPTAHHVGKLITIAAPWLGAPKATRIVVHGDFLDSKVLNFFTRASFKSLSEFFPSVHELMPSKAYYELVGVAPPYILDGRSLSYEQTMSLLNTRFATSMPGNANGTFHLVSQDDWHDSNNPVNTSVEYHHLYGVKAGSADSVATVVEERLTSCPPLLGCFTFRTTFKVVTTAGDGTVPTLSALRSDGLNAPGVSRSTGRIKPFVCAVDCDHLGLVKNPDVKNEILQILQASVPAVATADQESRGVIENGAEAEVQPAYYLTVVGTASASIRMNSGSSTDPLADPPDNNLPSVTSYIVGEQSFMSVMPVGQSYTITLRSSSTNPMIIQLTRGTDAGTTQAIRYLDFSLPPSVFVRLEITPQGVDALRYDANGDGTFESIVSPTVSVTGGAAADTEPPSVSISATTQGNIATVSINSEDSGSGIKRTYFSLNGINFQPYTAPFTVSQYQAPTIYSFSDDNVGNRSGLVTHQLINFGVPVLITHSNSVRGIALDSVLQSAEPFRLTYDHLWGSDRRTRIMLFALNFDLALGETASAITATAEDGSGRIIPLVVENVVRVPGAEWMICVIVKLNDEIGDVGDVLVRISYHGTSSNGVRIGIGHIGDGPANTGAPAFLTPRWEH